ncbi:hypothetical protein GJ744_001963 [Endocarpon pusillum]|uniref:A to I editase domain-containing protein n=1 Tax=Endocarpon pusillum TaxID=364733 RepID=A0A8H7ACM4_9EURO|nr:hypothetical protein GJ744_001963 [Endocarpon pusillum]
MMGPLEERIAAVALHTFDDLPKKSKPRSHAHGSREWVPMSAVVLVRDANSVSEKLTCVSLATGCKCLPRSTLPKCHGQVLHDSHAEILSLRGLNQFFLFEVSQLLDAESTHQSEWLCAWSSPDAGETIELDRLHDNRVRGPPFAIRSNVSIHMFSSEAPCGDASMEMLMSELGAEESVPWTSPHREPPTSAGGDSFSAASLHGRGFFSDLGAVRRKPSRADAEPTLSKSCTDKLSIKQVTSLLSFPTYHLIAITRNAYLSSLILPATKYSGKGFTRAFSRHGRLSAVEEERLPNGYSFHPFKVTPLRQDFEPNFPFSKPVATTTTTTTTTTIASSSSDPCQHPRDRQDALSKVAEQKSKATNLSALYIHHHHPRSSPPHHPNDLTTSINPVSETLVNGVHQGHTLTSPSPKKASIISRFHMLQLGRQITTSLLLLHLSDPPSTTGTGLHVPPPPPSRLLRTADEAVMAGWKGLVEARTYGEAKRAGEIALDRERAKGLVTRLLVAGGARAAPRAGQGASKDAAGGSSSSWLRNNGDDDWELPSEEHRSG